MCISKYLVFCKAYLFVWSVQTQADIENSYY